MHSASTQYKDFAGTAAGDWHPQEMFTTLAEIAGIDTNCEMVVGVKIWGTPPQITALYVVDLASVGGSNMESISMAVRENPSGVRMREARLEEYQPLDRHFKQFEAVLCCNGIDFSAVPVAR